MKQMSMMIDLSRCIGCKTCIVACRNGKDLIDHAEQVLATDPRVLPVPAPMIVVLELSDSSVNLGVRPFVKAGDYWQAQWDLTEYIKQAFDAAGITIPFPQRDIHVIASPATEPPSAA